MCLSARRHCRRAGGPGGTGRCATLGDVQTPLAHVLRPQTLQEVLGQDHILAPDGPVQTFLQGKHGVSLILWGPPGSGKTSIAHALACSNAYAFVSLVATDAGIPAIRKAGEDARKHDRPTVLFVDEIHRLNKTQQDALLPLVESGTLRLIGATTENPYAEVTGPLLSRSLVVRLHPLGHDDIARILQRGAQQLGVTLEPDAREAIIGHAAGDARQALNMLQAARAVTDGNTIELRHAQQLGQGVLHQLDQEQHYDMLAAYIQSMSGSDPDAAVYWLVRMIEAGQDPKLIARRNIVLAGEDIGMADPQALVVATACAQAVAFVGLPECMYAMTQCAVYLASAPKSNACAKALWAAQQLVRSNPPYPVPRTQQSRENWWHKITGAGEGYRYPHDEDGYCPGQTYLPDELVGTRLYEPTDHGHERDTQQWLAQLRSRPVPPASR